MEQRPAMPLFLLKLAVFTLVTLAPLSVRAVVFDWDSISWAAGSTSNSYDIDPSNPGNDITISITGNTSRFITNYPQKTQDFEGGLSPTEDILDVYLNFSRRNQSITITVDFTYVEGVEDIAFTLFDIDRNGTAFIDEISSIRADYAGGPDIAATSVIGSPNNTVSGSGLGTTITGNTLTADTGSGSGDANATISFGTNQISSFSFVYGNASGVDSNPSQQGIGFWDMTYKRRVPEFHPRLIGVAFCLMLVLGRIVSQLRGQSFLQFRNE